jgi:hypothetical protein
MHMGSNERGAYYDKTGKGQRYLSDAVVDEQKNWPTVCASEVRQGFQDRSRGMKGSQESLTTAVVKDAANWPTPDTCAGGDGPSQAKRQSPRLASIATWATPSARDSMGHTITQNHPQGFNKCIVNQVILGQAAPASSSSLGSRQGFAMRLNPRWVEVLQGLPIGWTMPSCTSPQTIAPMSCDSSAMELSQPQQSGLSEFSLAS